ncbi:hypothetical protein OG401_16705 [Kitasatospora purpeofusca]|uniref:hypothetical protein n=1 Tax=Kitasatospora purpeofusca TaxID=67352 RepID=UPI00225727F8|nr:hypothetical protein [Kitasatospora purpeofusca]MCX4685923.1 hypothetical protein [Kitasatospora purpeofusca]
MRIQHRRSLALAAAATLVSGVALTAAPGAAALSRSGGSGAVLGAPAGAGTPGPVGTPARRSPVTVTVAGFPGTLAAGGPAAEFTATLHNSADHAVDVTTGFVVANVDAGIRENQLTLGYQSPGGASWKPATLAPGAGTGATWNLDTFATRLSLPAGASATYRLRLAVTADAPAGRATAGFTAVVADPTLPPETRITEAASPQREFTVTAGGPTGTPTTAPAPGVPYLGLDAVPGSFTAGAEPKPFRLTLTNRSGKDVAFLPELTFRGKTLPAAEAVRLEFRSPDGEWLPAVDGGQGGAGGQGGSGRLTLTLRTGDKEASLVRLRDGESRTLNVRLAFAQDAPAGVLSLLPTGNSLPTAGTGAGVPAAGSAVDITVAAAAPSAVPSTSPAEPGGSPSAPAAPPAAEPPAPAPTAPGVGLAAVTPSADPSGTPAAVPVSEVTQTPPGTAAVPAPAVTVTVAAPPVPSVDLASTGGSSTNTPMAITGATSIAMGIGTLVVAHRRQRTRPAGVRTPLPAGGPAAGPGPRPAAGGPAPRSGAAPAVRPAPGPAAGPATGPTGPAAR